MKKLASILSIMALAACGGSEAPSAGGSQAGCMTRAYEEIGGPVSLIDETGRPVTQDAFKGRPTMVFFGFTYCPDICPMTLTRLKDAYARLPDGVEPPLTALITVDPERDTPEKMKAYVETEAFPEAITGLTGTEDQIRAAADAFVADYQRIEQSESLAGYTMDHTSLLYLMDETWSLKTFFTHQDTPDDIANCLTRHLG